MKHLVDLTDKRIVLTAETREDCIILETIKVMTEVVVTHQQGVPFAAKIPITVRDNPYDYPSSTTEKTDG